MRKHLLEIVIGLLITIGAALVIGSGYLSYQSISAIVSSIHKENKPDEKLLLIRDIATGLDKAEDGIRIYAYSRRKSDLAAYKLFLQNIEDQVYTLQIADSTNISFLQNIDTISDLIEQKLSVWNEILSLYNTKVANQYLDTISEQLESKVESDSVRKNRKFFKKVFKRHKKEEIDEEKIIQDIEQFKQEDNKYALQAKQKELKLARTSNELTGRLYNLINKIQEDERIKRQHKANEADSLAKETYVWIGWLTLSGTLSALLVIIVLSIYIRKTRASHKALEASKLQTENLTKTKELFMANVSHELRTPMNAISGFVDQLLKKPLEESLKSTLNIIKSSSDHLVKVINEVLDFSKLQSGKMKLEAIHFNSSTVLDEIKYLFKIKAEEKQIEYTIEKGKKLPEVLFGDEVRLKQILINLISNAIKFTKNGSVNVFLDAENLKDQKFILSIIIEDTGIGIDKDNLDNIFEDFTQAEVETTRKFGGTGLGLSIVKKLIDLQKGTIKVESIKNKGSRFTCKIPYESGNIDKIEGSDIIIPAKIPEGLVNKKVLIADDEIYNRKLISSILKKWKMAFDQAEDGEKAIELLSKQQYDIIILDKQMPGADGLAVAKHIRQTMNRKQEEVSIILSSAAIADKDDLIRYKSLGIDAYLPKPFTEELLLSTLIEIFNTTDAQFENDNFTTLESNKENSSEVNLDELYNFAGNDLKFVMEMLNSFKESFERGFNEMNQFLKDNNMQEINNTAHKMASPCRHIGAEKLLELVKRAEHESQMNKDTRQIKKTFAAIENEYELVKSHIDDHIIKLNINPD